MGENACKAMGENACSKAMGENACACSNPHVLALRDEFDPFRIQSFGTHVEVGTIQRRLAWLLYKDDTMRTNPVGIQS